LTLPRLRRLSQTLFLGLFLVLLCEPAFRGSSPFLKTDPLVAFASALATHALYRGLLWSLAILVPTLVLGRFFCGWICPLGSLHHLFGSVQLGKKSGRQRLASNRYQPWQTFKYYLLFALLLTALWGSALAGILDPIALAVRSFALALVPAATRGHTFRQAFPLGAIFLLVLATNLLATRLWCRALCPLGALLGLASRWSILGLRKAPADCADCNRCLLHCQGGDDPIPGAPWRKSECILCMNCVAACPEGGVQFRFFPPAERPAAIEGADLKRRHVLAGLAAGAVTVPLLRANTGLSSEPHERRIRPPAALDEMQFLARCIRCGECMKVCPNNALHSAFTEAGWEGIWTPVLAPRVGYCEPSCTLCGEVCPTGAIWEFTLKEKAWTGAPEAGVQPIRLGTAFYDRGRCLPWAMATDCIVCEEWCPTSPKAVYLLPAEVTDAGGSSRQVRQPYIDPAHCVGCGACEFACPVRDRPAVYVTSVGESRSKANQILLQRVAAGVSWLPESGDAADWAKTSATRTFESDDLWKYVDGDAERYLRAGVRRTLTASYKYAGTVEAVADIHLMESARAAAAIFESEPSAGSRSIALGDAGRSYGQSLTFHRGRFFVRLVAYQQGPQTEQGLMKLAGGIDARLPRQ
jgi:polyferredoxin